MENTSRWQRLIEGELPPAQRPAPAIYASWLRCRSLMQPAVWKAPHCALGATFASICQRKNDLLTLGQAALEDACEYMEQRRCLLAILDESGCMLWLCGDVLTRERLQLLGFTPAPTGRKVISAPMHRRWRRRRGIRYRYAAASTCVRRCTTGHSAPPQSMTTAAVNAGQLRWAVCWPTAPPASLSLTLALAREIGNSLNADGLLAESNRHLNQLYGLLDGVDDGVMAWDHRGYLQYINQRAATLLKLDEQQSQGKPLTQLLTLPALLNRAIAQRQALQHVEVTFESQRQLSQRY
jgi:transcriptional activator for dhaKLM operon